MTRGIGTDIVLNSRFTGKSGHFLEKIFTERELREMEGRVQKEEYLASRFAAKEAVVKALGTGFRDLTPLDIEIQEDDLGRPFPVIPKLTGLRILLSISHEKDYSIAMAVAEDE